MGAFSLVHTVGGIAGPMIGGVITSSSLTWRWYFSVLLKCDRDAADANLPQVFLSDAHYVCCGIDTFSFPLER